MPLAALLAAIREGRRYVPVGARGFVRLEEALRAALARADAAVFESGERFRSARSRARRCWASSRMRNRSRPPAASRRCGGACARARLRRRASRPRSRRRSGPTSARGVAWMARLAHWGAGAILADEMGLGKTLQTLAVLVHRAPLGPRARRRADVGRRELGQRGGALRADLKVRLYRGGGREAALRGLGLAISSSRATRSRRWTARRCPASVRVARAGRGPGRQERLHRARQGAARPRRALAPRAHGARPSRITWARSGACCASSRPACWGAGSSSARASRCPSRSSATTRAARPWPRCCGPSSCAARRPRSRAICPPRTELVRVVRLSPEEQELYEQLRKATVDEIAAAKKDRDRDAGDLRFVLLAALTRLRQLCCHPRLVYPRTQAGSSKAAYLLDLLADLREDAHKALVFSQFRSFLECWRRVCDSKASACSCSTARRPSRRASSGSRRFRPGLADVFLISLKAGRLRAESHGGRHGHSPGSVVEPGRRGSGDGARAPHRANEARDGHPAGGARHDRGIRVEPARGEARAGRGRAGRNRRRGVSRHGPARRADPPRDLTGHGRAGSDRSWESLSVASPQSFAEAIAKFSLERPPVRPRTRAASETFAARVRQNLLDVVPLGACERARPLDQLVQLPCALLVSPNRWFTRSLQSSDLSL